MSLADHVAPRLSSNTLFCSPLETSQRVCWARHKEAIQ
jgi:hypothetical protein